MQPFIWKPDDTCHLPPKHPACYCHTLMTLVMSVQGDVCCHATKKTPFSHSRMNMTKGFKVPGEKNILFTKQVLVSKGFSVSKQRLAGLCRSQTIFVNTTAQGFQPENSALDTVSATLSASVQISVSAVSLHFGKHGFWGGIYAQLTGSKVFVLVT